MILATVKDNCAYKSSKEGMNKEKSEASTVTYRNERLPSSKASVACVFPALAPLSPFAFAPVPSVKSSARAPWLCTGPMNLAAPRTSKSFALSGPVAEPLPPFPCLFAFAETVPPDPFGRCPSGAVAPCLPPRMGFHDVGPAR